MSTAAERAAADYLATLNDLTENHKTKINLLTILAEDYMEHAEAIVQVIKQQILQVYTCLSRADILSRGEIVRWLERASFKERFVRIIKVPVTRKLPILYVMDSILKNIPCPPSPYRALFANIIHKIFVHVFKEGDERVRASLYKLRMTWTDILPRGKLYSIDMTVHEEDNAWPIQTPRANASAQPSGSSGTVHVNPRFVQKQHEQQRNVEAAPTGRQVTRSQVSNSGGNVSRNNRGAIDQNTNDPRLKRKHIKKEASPPTSVLDELLNLPPAKPSLAKTEPEEPMDTATRSPLKRKGEELGAPVDPIMKKRPSPTPQTPFVRDSFAEPMDTPKDLDLRTQTILPVDHDLRFPKVEPGSFGNSHGAPHLVPKPPVGIVSAMNGLPMPTPYGAPPLAVPLGPMVAPPYMAPPVAAASLTPPVEIVTEGVRFEGIPANNRIFVEGKSHEVFFIENAAVIEKNGLPHRISFRGTERKVIIDGVVYMLGFDEEKTVLVDGLPHTLKFGAPSQELFMGNHAFRGQFGGQPIAVAINGKRHEIRLGGPPPDVQVDPEPSYELCRFMPSVQNQRIPPPAPVQPQRQAEDALAFLKRLKATGVLGTVAAAASAGVKQQTRESTPPIPSDHRLDAIERRAEPTAPLKDYNIRILNIRYDAIVNALHEKVQNACPHCGMRMQLKGDKYQKHLDWHVKRNLRLIERTTTCRPWYCNEQDWLKSEEEIEAGPSAADLREGSPAPAVSSRETNYKMCYVCREPFKEYFDEDDDEWMLQNCVLHDGKAFHSSCVQDASALEPKMEPEEDCDSQLSIDSKDVLKQFPIGSH